MDVHKVDAVVNEINHLEYEDKLKAHSKVFSLGNFMSGDMNDKLILISLVALTTNKLREKDPTITPLKILMQITNQIKDNSGFYQFLESLSILVEDLSYDCKRFDTCGMKDSQEIINKI